MRQAKARNRPAVTQVAAAIGGIVVLALAGCSGTPSVEDSGPPSDDRSRSAPPAPSFTGPHAEHYLDAWNDTNLDFVRDVIRDERVSDQEWAEVVERMDRCFAGLGIDFLGFEPDGGYAVHPGDMDPDLANDNLAVCELESGEAWIGLLRSEAAINPEGLDFDQLVLDCMIDRGAVDSSYALEEYRRDYVSTSFPYIDPISGEQIWSDCHRDPLSLLEDE